MSKERLEAIKELVKKIEKIESILYDEWRWQELTNLIESLYYAGHVDWLIQQAERVQELEEELVKYRNSFELQLLINNNIKNQIKRYREALEEIANKKMTYADMFVAIRTAKEALGGED